MAYCVHCGVKLGETERACPLCGTEAIDPAAPAKPSAPKPFPVRTPEQTLRLNHRYAVSLLTFLLLVPAAICLLIDMIGGGVSWSIYPAGVLALIWIVFTVPLLMRRHRLYSTILITGAALAGYLFMCERLSPSAGWFFPIVLPALTLFVAMICLEVALIRKWKVRVLVVVAVGFVLAGLLAFAVELLCTLYVAGSAIHWSPFVMLPCFFIALLIFIIYRNEALYRELRRRLHF